MLNITEIRVHKIPESNSLLAGYASITLDDCFVIHGIKILKGDRGLFVGMPRRRRHGMPSQDICHPLNIETRQAIEEMILDQYAQAPEADSSQDYKHMDMDD